jgi:hypothetical protein
MNRFRKFWVFIGSLLVLVLLLLAGSSSAQDTVSTGRWSPPKFVDWGWWQYPALDNQGNLHIVWYTGEVNQDELSYVRRNSDGTWTKSNDIFCPCVTGFTVRNAIAATSDGELHVVYRSKEAHFVSNAYFNEGEFANKWTAPVNVSNNAYYVDMMADHDNVLHLVYSQGVQNKNYKHFEDDPCLFCTDIFYRRSTDDGLTWSDPINVSNTPDGSERMDITQGESGRLFIAWSEGFDGWHGTGTAKDVRLAYSDDKGLTWSDPIILDGGNNPNKRPTNLVVAELRDKRILAVWRYSGLVDWNFYYQLSADSGKTWTDPLPVPGFLARDFNSNKYDASSMVVDQTGVVHFFAVGQAQEGPSFGNAALYHIQFAQDNWFRVERVYQAFDETPEWPKAIIGLQNDIHLTWFTRVFNANGVQLPDKDLKIYYSHLDGNIQDRPTEVFLPTQTPVPTATQFVAHFEATPTPVATLETSQSALYLATQDVYAIQTLLGGLLAAGIFCVIVFIIFRFFRQS